MVDSRGSMDMMMKRFGSSERRYGDGSDWCDTLLI